MTTNWFFGDWPFATDEEVLLDWITSPYKEKDGNFYIDLIFRRQQLDRQTQKVVNFSFVKSKQSLGLLPGIRFGSVYENRQYLREHNNSKVISIDFPDNVSCNIESVNTCLPPNTKLPKADPYFSELCLVIDSQYGTKKIIIPCMELIRFFFASNTLLAYEILTFDKLLYVQNHQIYDRNTKRLELNFPHGMASTPLSSSIIKKIALIVLQGEDWNYSFKEVGNKRIEKFDQANENAIIPLECIPPTLANSTWKMKVLGNEDYILVMEIYGVKTKQKLPFSEIIAYHPDKYEIVEAKPKLKSNDDNAKILEVPTPINIISAGSYNPKNTTQPVLLTPPVQSFGVSHASSCKLTWKIDKQKDKTNPLKLPDGTINIKSISLNDRGGKGEMQSGEFNYYEIEDFTDNTNYIRELSLSPLPYAPDKFDLFFGTIRMMGLESYYKIDEIKKIEYALVYVKYGGKGVFLLELNTSGHSTLIFRTKKTVHNMQDTITKLILDSYSQTWERPKLRQHEDIRIIFATHVHKEAEKWKNQLFRKISVC